MKRFFLLSCIMICWSSICSAEIIYVKHTQDSPEAWQGRNPVYSSIQSAIDLASSGDEIWVAKGTYFESLVLRPEIKLFGGFEGTENSIGARILWNLKPTSIIDGGGVNRCILADSSLTIDGFTLKNGGAVERGAGINIVDKTNIEIRNLFIESCYASWIGAGIYIGTTKAGTISLERIVIWKCHTYCGALEIEETSRSIVHVKNCTIVGNNSYGLELPLHEVDDGRGNLVPISPTVWNHSFINMIAWNNVNTYNIHAPKPISNSHDVWCWAREFLDYSFVGNNAWDDASMEDKWQSPKAHTVFEKEFDWLGAPGFVDPDNGDFRLLPDSPCLDAGLNGVDLGAYPANDISVRVTYYHTQNPMPDVKVNLTDNRDDSHRKFTDNNGDCQFTNIINGAATFQLTIGDESNDAIAGSDALLILQYLAFLTNLTDDQQLAADVTADGSVSGSDAQAILRYLAFYSENVGNTGEWRFAPNPSMFIIQKDTTIGIKTYLLGDVSGNWSAPNANLKKVDFGCQLKLDHVSVDSQRVIRVPVRIENLAQPLHTAILTIEYDAEILTYQNAELSDSCCSFMIAANGAEPGKVHLALASVTGVVDDQNLVEINFQINDPSATEAASDLRISRALINDILVQHVEHAKIYVKNQEQYEDALTKFSFYNHPNPFNLTTTISFSLPDEAHVSLSIFNMQGQRVTKLMDEKLIAGNHQIDWMAKTPDGNSLPAGVYFCRIEIAANAASSQQPLCYSTKLFLLK